MKDVDEPALDAECSDTSDDEFLTDALEKIGHMIAMSKAFIGREGLVASLEEARSEVLRQMQLRSHQRGH